MKSAISIPDRLFDQAEKTARRLKVSRSELSRRALRLVDDGLRLALDLRAG
jgi:hypothetical protein